MHVSHGSRSIIFDEKYYMRKLQPKFHITSAKLLPKLRILLCIHLCECWAYLLNFCLALPHLTLNNKIHVFTNTTAGTLTKHRNLLISLKESKLLEIKPRFTEKCNKHEKFHCKYFGLIILQLVKLIMSFLTRSLKLKVVLFILH